MKPAPKNCTIVVIDDDGDDNYIGECMLGEIRPGTEVAVFSDPEVAIAYLASGTVPMVVICDMIFPTTTGIEIIARIQQLPDYAESRFPIVLMSGAGVSTNQVKGATRMSAGYFRKRHTYFDQCELLKMIVNYWEASEAC